MTSYPQAEIPWQGYLAKASRALLAGWTKKTPGQDRELVYHKLIILVPQGGLLFYPP